MIKSLHQTSVDLLVPFHDIDIMEVVWHGHYVKYFEIARCALLEKIHYNYPQMLDSGYSWPVIDLNVRYIKPSVFGQVITVQANIVEWENRLKINYLITDKLTGSRLTKGYSIQVAIDSQTKEMCFESPKVLFEKLGVLVS
ncbi:MULTISPECIES: thioesterase family protein [Methylobacter]|uniref:acyl-CoA thioesterase n=1 Tax=Methylobacter TaxID=429 RepID=UPI001FAD7C54|nr:MULTISPECIES: acyl-CoA thioesterase [Methylobacter]UOA10599.1 acyl-CoA thioesterase [Methylobacter sp. S3L5C]